MPPELPLQWIAIIASALYGVLAARRAQLDLIGTFATTFLSALGGGTLRDLLIDRRVFWLDSSAYVLVILAVAILGSLLARRIEQRESWLAIPDAIGLGLFTVLGTRLALEAQCPPAVAALLGVITGSCGGVLTDLVCGQIPRIFRPAPLYATCALAGTLSYLVLIHYVALPPDSAALIAATVTAAMRLIAFHRNWQLPDINRSSA